MFYIINVHIINITYKICAFYYYVQKFGFTTIIIMYRGYGFTAKTIQVILYATMIIIKFPIETFI